MLAGVRMVAFLLVAPPFSYSAIPMQVKAMLGLGLALAVSPHVVPGYAPPAGAGFLGALVLEVVVGLALGFLVMLVFAAVQGAGHLIDMFGGFQLAQAFDPQTMVNGAQFTRLFHVTALALLFASDGYQLIVAGLARTFAALPIGTGLDLARPAEAMAHGVAEMFLAALQIAGPLIIVLVLADLALGLLTRVAPAMNVFAMGFPLKILLTLILSVLVIVVLPQVVASLTDRAVEAVLGTG